MFKIYDLNMKELPFPEGVKPLDIFVSSVNKRRLTEEFEGRVGTLNYGYDYGERSVDLSLWLEAHDTIDYRLIRNELYAFFDTHDVFYIEETRVPSRVLKVTIDESYIPERINQTHSLVEISCRTLDSVFWESKYTTLELHDSGYSATAEKYGLVDNIDDEKVKYRFEPDLDVISFDNPNAWERGSINSTTGVPGASDTNIRMKNFISIIPGKEYTIKETLDTPNLQQWWVMEYDNSDNFVGWVSTPFSGPLERTFIARGSKLKLRSGTTAGNTISPSDVGVITIPELTSRAVVSTFTVYNAGNVTVEPESSYLVISVKNMQSLSGFKITNKSTGEVHEHTQIMGVARDYEVRGLNTMRAGSNVFRYTNRRFIRLKPGDNLIEVSGGTFSEINFEFKFMYK